MEHVLKPRQTKHLPASRRVFRSRLLDWFEAEARDYPWRRTHDPYEVLVSEVMLQQTQIATVLGKGYYTRFLEAFPTLQALAAANDETLLKAWEGLGYYRRARMLRETARAVVEMHEGQFPSDLDALLKLPGIGRYTAGALRAFAFGLPAVLVDGNVARVLARLMDYEREVDSSAGLKQIWEWAETLADDTHPRFYHAALMELGQRICRPKQPDCVNCPVAICCAAKTPEALPKKKQRIKVTEIHEHAIWVRDGEGRILMQQEGGKRRTGLWKLPIRDPESIGKSKVIAKLTYGITRYKVRLQVHEAGKATPEKGEVWVEEDAIFELAMAAPFKKVIGRLLG